MAKVVMGVIVFACASGVLLASGRSQSGRSPDGTPGSSPVTLAFSASERGSTVSEVFLVHDAGRPRSSHTNGCVLRSPNGRRTLPRSWWWSPRPGMTLWRSCRRQPVRSGCCAASTVLSKTRPGRRRATVLRSSGTATRSTINRQGDNLQDLAPGALETRGTASTRLGRLVGSGRHGDRGQRHACLRRPLFVVGPGDRRATVSGACSHSHPDATYDDIEPTWSATGREIAYTRRRGHHSTLYRLNLAHGHPTRYRLGAVGISCFPAWSPLASAPPPLAFRSTRGVYVYDPRRATATRLSAIAPITGAAWSADATRIAYLTNPGTFNASPWLVISGIYGNNAFVSPTSHPHTRTHWATGLASHRPSPVRQRAPDLTGP